MPPVTNIPPTIASLLGNYSIYWLFLTFIEGNNSKKDSTHSGDIAFENEVNGDRKAKNEAASRRIIEGVCLNIDHVEILCKTIKLRNN